mmetsp:Transcript_2374/g.5129  ORF Transcript_2374/g.5129 Transcript_2374/m.5129 type:complete len:205 (-) Transcript_2374:131-745(-)
MLGPYPVQFVSDRLCGSSVPLIQNRSHVHSPLCRVFRFVTKHIVAHANPHPTLVAGPDFSLEIVAMIGNNVDDYRHFVFLVGVLPMFQQFSDFFFFPIHGRYSKHHIPLEPGFIKAHQKQHVGIKFVFGGKNKDRVSVWAVFPGGGLQIRHDIYIAVAWDVLFVNPGGFGKDRRSNCSNFIRYGKQRVVLGFGLCNKVIVFYFS